MSVQTDTIKGKPKVGIMAQMVECLPSKCKTLSPAKKRNGSTPLGEDQRTYRKDEEH
jgi:hypothetical protein